VATAESVGRWWRQRLHVLERHRWRRSFLGRRERASLLLGRRRDTEARGRCVVVVVHLGLRLLRRRHGLLVLLLDARVDNVGISLGGRVVDNVDARLDFNGSLSLSLSLSLGLLLLLLLLELLLLQLIQLLLLSVQALLSLRILLSLRVLSTAIARLLLLRGLRLDGQSSKFLLEFLLALSEEKTRHLELLESVLVHALGRVVGGRCQDLLGKRVHLTRGVHSVLLRHVKTSAGGGLRDALLLASVSVVSPLRHIVLGLVVRSGSRDRRGLGLGAQTCEEVRATGAWSGSFDGILADRTNLGREGNAQPLGVEAGAARAEAGGRGIEPGGREAVRVVVISHLSETTSVHALVRYRMLLVIRLECRKCKYRNVAVRVCEGSKRQPMRS